MQLATGTEMSRNTTAINKTAKNDKLENLRQTRRINKESRIASNLRDTTTMSKSTMRKASGLGLRGVTQSVTGLADRMISVNKAVSKFKLARESNTAVPASQKGTPPANNKADIFQRVKNPRPKIPKDDHTPIKEQSKNVIKFKTADLLANKFDPVNEIESETKRSDTKDIANSPPNSSPPK